MRATRSRIRAKTEPYPAPSRVDAVCRREPWLTVFFAYNAQDLSIRKLNLTANRSSMDGANSIDYLGAHHVHSGTKTVARCNLFCNHPLARPPTGPRMSAQAAA